MRAVTARALASGVPEKRVVPGVLARSLLAWALGTGVPVFGLLLVALFTLVTPNRTPTQLSVTILALGGAAVVVGLLVAVLAAKATADPVVSVQKAQRQVERGDLDVEVPVYDGSEAGLLQAGFNRMVGELRERERLREVFGTYVDEAVAEHILEEGVSLDGEEIDVTLLFLDVRDFTGLAESTPAREVVAKLNELFEAVVPVVHEHGGHVDKFVGDGLLAVFGAPRRSARHADDASAAALEIVAAVEEGKTGPRDRHRPVVRDGRSPATSAAPAGSSSASSATRSTSPRASRRPRGRPATPCSSPSSRPTCWRATRPS